MLEIVPGSGIAKLGTQKASANAPLFVGATSLDGAEMATEKSRALAWQLTHVREAIASDWDALASGNLNFEQRKSVREHLNMNQMALRDLMAQRRTVSVAERMRRLRQL